MLTIQERVAQGVTVLDAAKDIPNWRSLIDLDRLQISNYSNCILGQLFGDFGIGADALGLNDADAKACGFDCTDATSSLSEFPKLQAEWERVIGWPETSTAQIAA